MTEKGVMSAN